MPSTAPNQNPQYNHFINTPDSAVEDMIDGLLLMYPSSLTKIESQNVIIRKDLPKHKKVFLLSGGGSGHEPSHAGWIGDGMLDGAICGGMFASPSVKQILSAIRAVTSVNEKSSNDGGGCLLIVKNYTGDRLNFGMACEMANAEGRSCRMVVVADDCAVPRDKGISGARGVCGTMLVHKAAGAAAMNGSTLDEVVNVAERVAKRMGSLGVSIGSVCLPGQLAGRSASENEEELCMELGIGIHGEAGIEKSVWLSAKDIADKVVSTIADFGYGMGTSSERLKKGDRVALILNNLGATSNFEMAILAKEFVNIVEDKLECVVDRFYVGPFMTSFNMHGISLSILCLDANGEILKYLDAPTTAPAWVKSDNSASQSNRSTNALESLPDSYEDNENDGSSASALSAAAEDTISSDLTNGAIRAACKAILDAESQLTQWDLIVGDGDCGITMKRGATEVLERLDNGSLSKSNAVKLCLDLAEAVSQSMGGTSGILFELFFRKMAAIFIEQCGRGSPVDFGLAFKAGVDAVMFYGGAQAGYRTMLDALIPAADAFDNGIKAAAAAASAGADSTANMEVALAGRSNYLGEDQLRGTPDPGAKAVSIILCAIADEVACASS